jgi:hypothetical protein
MKHHEFKGVPVEQRGHLHLSRRAKTQTLNVFVTTVNDDSWLSGYASAHNAFSCALCDAYPSFDLIARADGPDGLGLRAQSDCLLPSGITTSISLDVPSGRIIVTDDLRPIYDVPDEYSDDTPGYNSAAGQALHVEKMAAIGCAYGPVQNTSPSLVRTIEDHYVIVSFDSESEADAFSGDPIARICTGLWAYSIADFDDFLRRAKALLELGSDDDRGGDLFAWVADGADLTRTPFGVSVVDIPAGSYLFTHHTMRADFDFDGEWPLVYADVKKIS